MIVKQNVNLEILLNYGFEKIDKELEQKNDEYTIASYHYKFNIGHSRRGQFYYLLVDKNTRNIFIYASKPDGDGTSILFPNVIGQLITDSIVEF